ncbi:MAG: hypothetical protein ACO2PP_04245 [Thermocrinis sp.]|jgi:hypothetical protein|uniref:hypothetical protein n=1 Tax=Thermocrinis sp. TaxID=2024383 RepID=UPI003C09C632
MKAYNYLVRCPSFPLIAKKFSDFVEFSKSVEVIPWQEEFAVADYNPEVIDYLEFLEQLLQMRAISQEEYEREVSKLPAYASKTGGVAFMEDNVVSFRDENPPEHVVVHEIGHCYFRENDRIWSASYGGGESLFWLILRKDLPLNELAIFQYHSWLRRTLEGQVQEVAKEIVKKLSKLNLPVAQHIYAYQLYAGTMGIDASKIPPHLLFDLKNKEWEQVKVSREGLLSFFANLIVGASLNDSVQMAYLKALFL